MLPQRIMYSLNETYLLWNVQCTIIRQVVLLPLKEEEIKRQWDYTFLLKEVSFTGWESLCKITARTARCVGPYCWRSLWLKKLHPLIAVFYRQCPAFSIMLSVFMPHVFFSVSSTSSRTVSRTEPACFFSFFNFSESLALMLLLQLMTAHKIALRISYL